MPRHGAEVPYELRCCIVFARLYLPPPQNQFRRIGRLVGVEAGTCQRVWIRARARAGTDDLREVLACVGSLERSGRPPRETGGTSDSADLSSLIAFLKDQDDKVARVERILTQRRPLTLYYYLRRPRALR